MSNVGKRLAVAGIAAVGLVATSVVAGTGWAFKRYGEAETRRQASYNAYVKRHRTHASEVDRTNQLIERLWLLIRVAEDELFPRLTRLGGPLSSPMGSATSRRVATVTWPETVLPPDRRAMPSYSLALRTGPYAPVAAAGETALERVAKRVGKASTGKPLKELHGAAADDATLAFLGGGAKRVAGGGKAFGRATRGSVGAAAGVVSVALVLSTSLALRTTLAGAHTEEIDSWTSELQSRDAREQEKQARLLAVLSDCESHYARARAALDQLESVQLDTYERSALAQRAGEALLAARTLVESLFEGGSGTQHEVGTGELSEQAPLM